MASTFKSLLSSQARIQAPWIKVTFGDPNSNKANSYTFGIFTKQTKLEYDANGFYRTFKIQYPNYIQDLTVIKTNGQVNQYTLNIKYPITPEDDPNFFEKIFSAISDTRKIIFTYGDASNPSFVYKNEEAMITKITNSFDLAGSSIKYTISATSSSVLGQVGCFSFVNSGLRKPSDEIKKIFKNSRYGLKNLFTGMREADLDKLIASDDKYVEISPQTNTSPLDYISYLASCMVPAGNTLNASSNGIYVMTIHDDTVYDQLYEENEYAPKSGSYFKIEKVSSTVEHSDAYELDIGFNTSTIVSQFSIEDGENYSLYFDYAGKLYPEEYTARLNNNGQWEKVYTPVATSRNSEYKTTPADVEWWSKVTSYPINATVVVQGLLRPVTLMSYIRLNVVFPGGGKHMSSGLYMITKQSDNISGSGYKTTLNLTKISGDNSLKLTDKKMKIIGKSA